MTTFVNTPFIEVPGDFTVYKGWGNITSEIKTKSEKFNKNVKIVVVEYYQGVLEDETTDAIVNGLMPDWIIKTNSLMLPEQKIREMVHADTTDDRIFGYMTRLNIGAYFDSEKVARTRKQLVSLKKGTVLVIGTGAAFVSPNRDILIYADMARWEIQLRMREHLVSNIGVNNKDIPDWMLLYKQGFFVDWRVCDRLKKKLIRDWDYVLDTNNSKVPKMIEGKSMLEGLEKCLTQPFSVVPFFDPGPWGGQWMKEKCNLDPEVDNYAWCFNCVPEENSLLLKFGNEIIEIPSINLVFFNPRRLLGDAVHGRFGDEFPIRFDYLDTFDGGNLSLQVHPLTEYIQEKFGLHYTQDESYYMLDARPGAIVYLGLKEGVKPGEMIFDLETAQQGGAPFDADRHVQSWPVKKHDHFLIPAGTVHCSGKNSMVLEISATPYIFTFKLWDWGRLGMDGKPRPINIEHGKQAIQWDRTTNWTLKNLVNQVVRIDEGDGWIEERTGLHEREFIETRRHWFTKQVVHYTHGGVNVLTLIEGDEIIVESPTLEFTPFVVHYAETFIVPAAIDIYTIRPYGGSSGKMCGTIKAMVRTNA
jgi:mannose-6-phosphate isomerase class I